MHRFSIQKVWQMTQEEELNMKKNRRKFDIREEYFVCQSCVIIRNAFLPVFCTTAPSIWRAGGRDGAMGTCSNITTDRDSGVGRTSRGWSIATISRPHCDPQNPDRSSSSSTSNHCIMLLGTNKRHIDSRIRLTRSWDAFSRPMFCLAPPCLSYFNIRERWYSKVTSMIIRQTAALPPARASFARVIRDRPRGLVESKVR
jgi:hypothetical protein